MCPHWMFFKEVADVIELEFVFAAAMRHPHLRYLAAVADDLILLAGKINSSRMGTILA